MKKVFAQTVCAQMICACLAVLGGCTDEGEGSGGDGGTGGFPAGGAGGIGGLGGAGGDAGAGGGGAGGASACLPAADFAQHFTVLDPSLCAVALYTAPSLLLDYSVSPTWGRHGGPLTLAASGADVTLTRWAVPSGATGALTPSTQVVPMAVDAAGFVAAQALDLPFFSWTALGWAGAFPATQGELVVVDGAGVVARYDVNSPFAFGAIAGGAADTGRLLFTGLSTLEDPMTSTNGLHFADACSAPSPNLGTGGGCQAPGLVQAWGAASGPVAVDSLGNVFSLQLDFVAGTQTAKGWAAASIAPGVAAPAAGTDLFTLPGGGTQLAALGSLGLLAFQAADPNTFAPLEPVVQRYAASVTPMGAPTQLLDLAVDGTELKLMTDDAERLWVGVPTMNGAVFVVLAVAE